jgi:hypothetical protein
VARVVAAGPGRTAPASSQASALDSLARTAAPEPPAVAAHPAMDMQAAGPDAAADGGSPAVSLDEYFDQLDAAFAHLRPGEPAAEKEPMAGAPGIGRDDLDWIPARVPSPAEATPEEWSLRDLASQTPIDMGGAAETLEPERLHAQPEVTLAPASVPARPAAPVVHGLTSVRPAVDAQMPGPPAKSVPVPPAPVMMASPPPIADAFAALLAAEQGEPAPPMGAVTGMPLGAPGISEPMIDEIVARVLGRLSDRVVRETVTEMVSRIAERLVREEIERIKGHAK